MSVSTGDYIFERLKQVGVDHIFGVPGDFNMPLLDHIYNIKGLQWVGCCNELNAGYAADGYARVAKVPMGVVITTYGVGELSALNAIAGAYSESIPLLHIVGIPSRVAILNAPFLHHSPSPHSLKKGNFLLYTECSKPLSCAQEVLNDPAEAPYQIDRVIRRILKEKQPGYLFVPVDTVDAPIPKAPLSEGVEIQRIASVDIDAVVDKILHRFQEADTSVIIGDALAQRFRLGPKIEEILNRTGAYGVTTLLGKGVIDETHPNFLGVYIGSQSNPVVKKVVESADFVLDVGPYHSDYNTGVFSREIDDSKYIQIHSHYGIVFGEQVPGVFFGFVIDRLLEKLPKAGGKSPVMPNFPAPQTPLTGTLKEDFLSTLFHKALGEDDLLTVETGSLQIASSMIKLPKGGTFVTQCCYASIGYALPSAVGAAVAFKAYKPNGRVVLIEGDGSAQMTVQEIATAIRLELPLVVFLINNDGYLIERALHGPHQPYNDISSWQWLKVFQGMGQPGLEKSMNLHQVRSVEEFKKVCEDPAFRNAKGPQFVEVFTGKFDYPAALKAMAEANNERNKRLDEDFAKKFDIK